MTAYFRNFKVFYGWWIVTALVLIGGYFSGVSMTSFTAIIEPISSEFGWNYTQISLAASMRSIETGILSPVIGVLIKHSGARKLIFAGILISSLGLFLLSITNSFAMFFGAFIVGNIGMSACSGVVAVALVGNWFRRRVSLATGIVLSATAVSGMMVPLVTWAIDVYDWRRAMVIFALASLIIFLPLLLVVRNKPEQYGYSPDGDEDIISKADETHTPESTDEVNITANQAMRSRLFWQITVGISLMFVAITGVTTHVMPYLSTIGIDRSTSGLIAGALPLTSLIGRVGVGWIGDKYNGKRIIVAGCIMVGLGLLIFSFISAVGNWMLVPFIIIFGIGWGGCISMMPVLLRQYFGNTNLSTLYGFSVGTLIITSIIGPPLAGWFYDRSGDYQDAWYTMIAISVVGIICVATSPTANKHFEKKSLII